MLLLRVWFDHWLSGYGL